MSVTRTEEGVVNLMVGEGERDCLCCPAGHNHVYGYDHVLDEKAWWGRDRDASDIVTDLLRDEFHRLGSAEAVSGRRIRVTVELLPMAAKSQSSPGVR